MEIKKIFSGSQYLTQVFKVVAPPMRQGGIGKGFSFKSR
jgi:hypothetical protein